MNHICAIFVLSISILLASCDSTPPVSQHTEKQPSPKTVSVQTQSPKTAPAPNKIIINDEMIGTYRELASRMGFDYDKEYGYREFWVLTVENKVGVDAEWEPLMLSTGGDFWDPDDSIHFNKQQVAWETFYYKNHNITWIRQIRHQGDHSYVKLLKLAEGRVPDLNLQ
ncbi:MAG: hypothetical protein U9R66_13095 [Thermodesulfobacteriota bacterium]|nr:hypothetical protein [Thermodesulfobacteriota bacterium]